MEYIKKSTGFSKESVQSFMAQDSLAYQMEMHLESLDNNAAKRNGNISAAWWYWCIDLLPR